MFREEIWSSLRFSKPAESLLDRTWPAATAVRTMAAIERRVFPVRARAAEDRIGRALSAGPSAAREIHQLSLESELREQADCARFMHRPDRLASFLPDAARLPRTDGPTLFASLHMGSPVLLSAFLHQNSGLDVRPIIRELGEGNPMASARSRWGDRKVRWLEKTLGLRPLGTDARSTAQARSHLLDGNALFAALDVPAGGSGRAAAFPLFGQRWAFASGALKLAALTDARVVPIIGISRDRSLSVACGTPQRAADADALGAAVFREFEELIRGDPGEWWMWPYLAEAPEPEPVDKPGAAS